MAFLTRFPGELESLGADQVFEFFTVDECGAPLRLAPNTLRRYRTSLRAFFKWAWMRGLVPDDAMYRTLATVDVGQGSVRTGRWLLEDEARALLAACRDGTVRGLRDEALLTTGVLTGLRAHELVCVEWRHVDLRRRRLRVLGKGRKPAEVGLAQQVVDVLTRWRATVTEVRGGAPKPQWPIFPAGRKIGGIQESLERYEFDWLVPYTTRGLRHVLESRADRAGIGRIAPHDMRRTFAGLLDRRNVDLRGIQAAMRHESPGTTVRHYLERDPHRAFRAVEHLTI